ncbi:hypothetical protein D3C76_435370 [compost metagenome]
MLDAEQLATSKGMASLAARWITSASLPEKPSRRNAATSGRSCGASTPCLKPMSARAFIFARPWRAASRGLDDCWLLLCEATLP